MLQVEGVTSGEDVTEDAIYCVRTTGMRVVGKVLHIGKSEGVTGGEGVTCGEGVTG